MATKKKTVDLGQFEGKDVLSTRLVLTNLGDGLSEAMETDPCVLHQDDEIYVIVKADVSKLRFDPVKGTDGVHRVQIAKASSATIADSAQVVKLIEDQERRNELRAEAEGGVARLALDGLEEQHKAGEHDFMANPECTLCAAAKDGTEPDASASKARPAKKGTAKKSTPRKQTAKAAGKTPDLAVVK